MSGKTTATRVTGSAAGVAGFGLDGGFTCIHGGGVDCVIASSEGDDTTAVTVLSLYLFTLRVDSISRHYVGRWGPVSLVLLNGIRPVVPFNPQSFFLIWGSLVWTPRC